MRNSAYYAKKVKRLLSAGPKAPVEREEDRIRLLVGAVLEDDATPKQAAGALAALEEEFVDFNELRAAPPKDIVECLGRPFPRVRAKSRSLTGALNAVFRRTNRLSLDYLDGHTKRDLRKALRQELGLSRYAESVLTLFGFDGHAIPVDDLLLEALQLDDSANPDSDLPDLQGFLERITLAKDAPAAHYALRAYAARSAPRVRRERARKERIARAKAEAKARAEAEAKAKAEAEAKAKAEAEEKAKKAKARKARAKKAKAKKAKAKKAEAKKAKSGKPKARKTTTARKKAKAPARKTRRAAKTAKRKKIAAGRNKPARSRK